MKNTRAGMKEISVLYLITGLRLGGAERQLLLLAEQMRARGLRVLVVAMEPGGVMVEAFKNRQIDVLELAITGAGTMAQGYLRLIKIVREFSPDLIHSHMIHANLFARLFKLFNPRYKLINTAHNIVEGGWLLMKGYSCTSMLANWCTNVSREAFEHYVHKGYFSKRRSSYIPNAVDTVEFCPDEQVRVKLRNELGISNDAYVFFSAGRLHEQKNHDLLLRSFKVLSHHLASAMLVIAGEGPLETPLRTLSSFLGITRQTMFLGRREDVPSLLNMCDCFVLSSKYEGFGLVTAEALATMKPVIATDCGGVREVLGPFGTLVESGDVSALSTAMLNETQCSTANERLLDGRRHIEEDYAISTVTAQWLDLYHHQL